MFPPIRASRDEAMFMYLRGLLTDFILAAWALVRYLGREPYDPEAVKEARKRVSHACGEERSASRRESHEPGDERKAA